MRHRREVVHGVLGSGPEAMDFALRTLEAMLLHDADPSPGYRQYLADKIQRLRAGDSLQEAFRVAPRGVGASRKTQRDQLIARDYKLRRLLKVPAAKALGDVKRTWGLRTESVVEEAIRKHGRLALLDIERRFLAFGTAEEGRDANLRLWLHMMNVERAPFLKKKT